MNEQLERENKRFLDSKLKLSEIIELTKHIKKLKASTGIQQKELAIKLSERVREYLEIWGI